MDKYEYLKNESLATAGNCCTIVGCCAGLAGLITPITGDWKSGLVQLICSVIMMTLAIDAFRGIRRTSTTEIEWEEWE